MEPVSIFRSGLVRPGDEALATVPVPLCPIGDDYIEFMDVLLNWPLLFPFHADLQATLRNIANQTSIVNQSKHQIGSIELGLETCFEREDRARLLLHLLFVHRVNLPSYECLPSCLQLLLRCLDKNQYAKWRNAPAVKFQFHCLASRDVCLPEVPRHTGPHTLSDLMNCGIRCVLFISFWFVNSLTH